ncbi:DNA cytosine methyltransferase [Gimesia algae]|uniref:DNA (cytosine-5-)-methyltransferase n=1 Tax=Gimesia algae TaxID=2527971 RepID=A0A517VLF7_9PLAN|nr:DNA cytosine methyltransferase [Gimesia algae]QDT93851.1 putative BsuMI modification methylase subunit YdiO [Gimesia algae]
MKIRVVDFFSGCGGTSCGLKSAGMKILLGIDNASDAEITYRRNFPRSDFICEDIRNVVPKDLESYVSVNRKYPLLFSACAPCQPFSQQNRNKVQRITKDHDASLLDEFHRFLKFFLPEYVFVENVPGLQKVSKRSGPFSRFIKLLESLKYSFDDRVVNSQDYGVPQRRQRLLLIGSRLGDISIPEATHGEGTQNPEFSTVRDWIEHFPAITAGEEHQDVPNHRARGLSLQNLTRLQQTPAGGDRRNWPKNLLLECHKEHEGHTDVYGRLWWDRPASALTTKCITISNGRFGHPVQDRAISVREAASLQTFPDDFIFHGSLQSMSRHIGNAVPALLAERIGKAIISHYRRYHRQAVKEGL